MRITWNELTVALDTHSRDDLLSEWRWQINGGFQIILISSLGDLFLSDSAGHIHWLDSGAGRLNEVAAGLDEFQQLRQQPAYVAEWFAPRLVGAILQRGVRLAPGQCFSYKLPPILGGQMEPTNFEATDLCVHLSILGQINRRAKDLPDGTPIERSSFIQPNASRWNS
ncbi:MAG TPA: T6SS immunity protein Tdi1 domain-containing protein [Chthoniobacteraceae bacterium]|nr:T6SS immunity protein Tdi1 domain-containing protein [Chthoniobacteraceae bacterium]